jgi:hypothetical protein
MQLQRAVHFITLAPLAAYGGGQCLRFSLKTFSIIRLITPTVNKLCFIGTITFKGLAQNSITDLYATGSSHTLSPGDQATSQHEFNALRVASLVFHS